MVNKMFELEFSLSKYAFASFGTAILALCLFVASMGYYYYVNRDEIMPYIIRVELIMTIYMISYGLSVSGSYTFEVVFWSKILYICITALSVATVYTVSYLTEKPYTWNKRVCLALSVVMMMLIVGTEKIITNDVIYIFHPTTKKGAWSGMFMIYYLYGTILSSHGIICDIRSRKDNMKDRMPLYIGIVFFTLHMSFTGYTSAYRPFLRPRLYVNIFFYIMMIIIFFYRHIQRNIQNKEKMFQQYIHDTLTKVYSRNYFFELLKKEVNKNYEYVLVGMLDMNHFKDINDWYGHLVGDEVLAKVGELLLGMKQEIAVGRVGGDEFMLYTTGLGEKELLIEVEKVMEAYREYLLKRGIDNERDEMGISFGYTECGNDMDLETIISVSDEAMYAAKGKGNNTIMKY